MKKTNILFIVLALACIFTTGCEDHVDESNMYTFLGKTITQYIQSDSNFTTFATVLKKSKISKKSESPLSMLLSARGNYTCFLPSNDAVKIYLDSIYGHKPYSLDTMSEITANQISQNCIIDNGNNASIATTSLQVGAIDASTLNDRHILVEFKTDSLGKFKIILNGISQIVVPDIKAVNGVIHVIDRVISPTNSTITSLIGSADNLKIATRLLEVTGWGDSMVLYRDESYENLTNEQRHAHTSLEDFSNYYAPKHRYYGYTAFVEPDSVFNKDWQIPMPIVENGTVTNYKEIMAAIIDKCKAAYPNATSDDLTSSNNAVNQFVSYHLLNYRVPYNQLIHHFNEVGFNPALPDQLTLDVWNYFETRGPRRLMKITQPATTGTININRHCTYDNTFFGTYKELSCDREGILVKSNNGKNSNNALNGFYYPINNVLVYDADVPGKVLNERLRFPINGLQPEFYNNYVRSNTSGAWFFIPSGYTSAMSWTNETQVLYRTCGDGWKGVQGDQLAIFGQYDVTFRLPPVPTAGTYEVRYYSSNLASRGMSQAYFGTNPHNLSAYGLPFDQRLDGTHVSIGWIADGLDEEANIENDKVIRNHGWMKGPKMFCVNSMNTAHSVPLRSVSSTMRRIVYKGYMEPDKIYYLRLKSVLENPIAYLYANFIELVPKNVYDNSENPEDIW